MNQREMNTSRWYRLLLAGLLVMLSVVLMAGTAFARYRTDLNRASLLLQTRPITYLYLLGPADGLGGYDPLPTSWNLNLDSRELDFSVTNGKTRQEYPDSDMTFQVSVFLTEETDRDFQLFLRTEDDSLYQSRAEAIVPDSPLYDQVGPGWIYRFYDASGVEYAGLLEGGKHTACGLTLICQGDLEDAELALLQMQVVSVRTE